MTTIPFNFSRADVEALVQITNQDEENKLDLFCYSHCDNRDTEFLKQCRGLIYCGETLVSRGFSYSDEYCSTERDFLEKFFTQDMMKRFTFSPSYEGTILRFFFYNNRWFISTHRKINAERSKWAGNKNFSKLFEEALIQQQKLDSSFLSNVNENYISEFQKLLSTDKQYLFLIRTRGENCIGSVEPLETEPFCFHVATLQNNEFVANQKTGIPFVEELQFDTISDILNYVDNCDYRKIQGIVCFDKNKHIKILNKNYMDLVELRGNEPSVPFRYLQVRGISTMKQQLIKEYKQFHEKFSQYEAILLKYAIYVHNCYIQRYIKRTPSMFPPQVHFVLCNCHNWHTQNRFNNIVTLDVVLAEIGKLQPHQLNSIIKEELNKNKENVNRTSTPENSGHSK